MEGHEIKPETLSDPVDAIIFAQKQEKKAEGLYRALAQKIDDPGIRTLMLELAEEEQKHWEKLQDILDTHFHKEF